MNAPLFTLWMICALWVGYQWGATSREPEVAVLRNSAEHDSIEIEELGELVKKCRKQDTMTPVTQPSSQRTSS